ncbi:hypothetical protein Plhal304r1_c015g0056031 [Plasmopara halstedii]
MLRCWLLESLDIVSHLVRHRGLSPSAQIVYSTLSDSLYSRYIVRVSQVGVV